ncbi:TonB-dependent receptor [Sphingosinicella sp.]|uniref:TonB-dependent receptor n=1 Tax=Sphingosinicella sp. TaxID=1917971 RepID=UPI0040380FC4
MSKTFWLLSAGLTALATPAYAQGGAQPAQTAENDDAIVVTAQGRRQPLQDVPLAVSAVNSESLQNSGANDIRQLNQLAPSLLVSSTGTEANGSVRIRGIGTVGDNPGLESSVAVFIDGVYRSRSGIGLNELGEVERIEVLRGPQGTLFGRNASAGLLHVITQRPRFEFGGMAEVTYGNYDYIRGQAAITGPITQQLAARLDAVYVRRDGFYDVVNPTGGTESQVNNRDRFFVRGQLLFEPSDDLSIRIIGDYSRREESCCGAVYVETRETYDPTPTVVNGDFAYRLPGEGGSPSGNRIVDILASLGGVLPSVGNPYNRLISITPGRTYEGDTRDWGASAQVDWDLGGARLTSITAYRRYRSEQPGDVDYNNVDILFRADDGNAFRRFETFTQELRLQGQAFGGRLDWLVGAYFASEDLQVRDNLRFGTQYGAFASCRLVANVSPNPALRNPALPGCMSPAGRATLTGAFGAAAPIILAGLDRLSTVNNVGDNNANYFQDSRNWAIFTHNIFNITDQLALTIGLRYTSENKDFSATFNNNNTICPTQQAFFSPFLTGGAAALPAALQPLAAGIVNLTCQGNSSSSLNALNLVDERDEDEWTGTGVLSFRPNNRVLLYASYSHGYKAGGFNLDRSALGSPIFAPGDPRQFGGRNAGFNTANLQFDAETVDAFELGFKYTGRNWLINIAAFHQRFSNFQLNTFNGSVFLVQNINGCGADLGTTDSDASNTTGACAADDVAPGVLTTGIEVEAVINPAPHLQITGGVTWANTRYRDDLVGRDTGTPLDSALFLLPGDNLSNAPSTVVTGSIAWTPPIPGTNLSALFYVDARLSSNYNTGSDLFPEKEQDAYELVNARIGIRGPNQRWSVELWAQNLFDTDYQQVAFNAPFQGGNSRAQVQAFQGPGGFGTANQLFASFLAEPRTFGITGRFRF